MAHGKALAKEAKGHQVVLNIRNRVTSVVNIKRTLEVFQFKNCQEQEALRTLTESLLLRKSFGLSPITTF